jgi:hypothetical protein
LALTVVLSWALLLLNSGFRDFRLGILENIESPRQGGQMAPVVINGLIVTYREITLPKASVRKAGVPRYFDVPRDSSYHRVSQGRSRSGDPSRVAGDAGLIYFRLFEVFSGE